MGGRSRIRSSIRASVDHVTVTLAIDCSIAVIAVHGGNYRSSVICSNNYGADGDEPKCLGDDFVGIGRIPHRTTRDMLLMREVVAKKSDVEF